MFRFRFFLAGLEPVREEIFAVRSLSLAQDAAREILEERTYEQAEIWKDGRVVGRLAGGHTFGLA